MKESFSADLDAHSNDEWRGGNSKVMGPSGKNHEWCITLWVR